MCGRLDPVEFVGIGLLARCLRPFYHSPHPRPSPKAGSLGITGILFRGVPPGTRVKRGRKISSPCCCSAYYRFPTFVAHPIEIHSLHSLGTKAVASEHKHVQDKPYTDLPTSCNSSPHHLLRRDRLEPRTEGSLRCTAGLTRSVRNGPRTIGQVLDGLANNARLGLLLRTPLTLRRDCPIYRSRETSSKRNLT